jgi:phosphatidylglycerol:prolipoprotein diacylglycerol transferase
VRRAGASPARVARAAGITLIAALAGGRLLDVVAGGHLRDFWDLCVDPSRIPIPAGWARACGADPDCGPLASCDVAARICRPARDCLAVLKPWRGGYALWGGALAGAAVGRWLLRRQGVSFARTADAVAPSLFLAIAGCRIGCYLSGCCFGVRTEGWSAVRFPAGSAPWREQVAAGLLDPGAPAALPVHPTQLYEAAACLALAALGCWLATRRWRAGASFAVVAGLYALGRGSLDFLRADARPLLGPISVAQAIGLAVATGAVVFLAQAPAKPPAAGR